jgi:two-component system, NarL family, response regulator DegU
MKKIKIIVVDDHPLFLKGLRDTLFDEEDFEIIGTASNGFDALDIITAMQPDVVTLDMNMPGMNGITVAKKIMPLYPQIKIIMLSMHKDSDIITASMACGVNGYVFKDDAVNDIVNAIRITHDNGSYISPSVIESTNEDYDAVSALNTLTKMEKTILKSISRNMTSKQIADENFISIKTVENHRSNIAKKLNLKGNNSLLKYALSGGL